MSRAFCKICNRPTTFNKRECLSCLTPIARAKRKKTETLKPQPQCPRHCGTGLKQIKPGRFRCNNCGAVFEADDFSFVDERPAVNAEKKERRA